MKISALLSVAAVIAAVTNAAPVAKRAAADGKVVVGYWVPWGATTVAQLDFTKFTHINYGFAVTLKKNADPTTITFDRYYDGDNIQLLTAAGKTAGVPILMSIGGWTGSQTFSTISASAANRTKFINNALVFVKNNTNGYDGAKPNGWNMDGIDIDWEYPSRNGAICNIVSPSDSTNYLQLLKELRAALDSNFPGVHKLLTAAVRVQPFDDANGPMADVSAYAQYYDWVNVMAYDIMGDWSDTTGPNAPYNNPNAANPYSFTQAAMAWLNAGFPANKIAMGTAFYGRSLTATVDMSAQNPITQYVNKSSVTPRGGPLDSNEPNSFCNEGSVYGGLWTWDEIRTGILTGGVTTPVAGWTRYWDSNTQTPWLYKASDKTYLSYDDPASLAIKVAFVNQQNLRGVMYWDATSDHGTELLDVLNQVHCTTNCPVVTTTTAVPTTTTTTVAPTTTTTTTTTTKATTTTTTTATVVTDSTTKSTTTTTTTPVTTTTPGGKCVGVQTWTASGVYVGGTKVQYQGNLYTAAWWTTNEVPGSTGQWGVWSAPIAC